VWALAFSPDGHFLVSSHGDGSILVWSVKERERVASLNEHSGPVRSVAYSSDGQRVASSGEDRSIIIWNAISGQKETTLIGHKTRITAVSFSPDGKRLASVDQDGFTFFWDLASRQPLWSRQYLQKEAMTPLHKDAVTISSDGRLIGDSRAVYESANGNMVVDFRQKLEEIKVSWDQFYGIAFSPDGRSLVCCSPSGYLFLWDTTTWQLLANFKDNTTDLTSVSFSSDGRYLVTGDSTTNEVLLWQVNPLRPIALLGKHKARVKSVAFSPDSRYAVSASDDHTVVLWDVNKRSLVTRIGTHTAPVLSVAFSPDGKRIVTGEHDKSVRIYERRRTLWGYKID
jgi:WD40 repeat protein